MLLRLVSCLLLGAAGALHAAGPAGYTGEAPVASQSDEDRAGAMQVALGRVISDQAGGSAALARPDVSRALGNAERYVLQYQYRRNSEGDAPLTLVVDFDRRAVDQLLTRLGLGVGASGAVGAASTSDTPTQATVWINGIRNADDYVRVIGYLGHNNFVRGAQAVQARGDGMLVRLALATDLPQFLAALALERTLNVDAGAARPDGVDATLTIAP